MIRKTVKKVVCRSLPVVLLALLAAPAIAKKKAAAAPQPELAVKQLAPVERLAKTPEEGVYYTLFVRSFADGDHDGIGDFKGLVKKLDYLNDGNDLTTTDLGITGIWLMPIFPSQSYHGYDVDDFYSINPQYGNMSDFETFIAECKKRGIDVILDMPLVCSSIYNEWFLSSKDANNPHFNWYRWITEDNPKFNIGMKTSNHDGTAGSGHNVWVYNKPNKMYYSGFLAQNMPDFNPDTPELVTELQNVLKFWLSKGVSGFRFDSAEFVYNSAKSPAGIDSLKSSVAWWKNMTNYIKTIRPDAFTVGDVWEATATRAEFLHGLDSVLHYEMVTKIVDIVRYGDNGNNTYANNMEAELLRYKQESTGYVDAPFISGPSQNRIAGTLRQNVEQLKLAAALYIFGEGVPFVYYGEEIGMNGGKPDEQIRSPMVWAEGKKDRNQTTWEESKYNKNTVPVKAQEKDQASLLQYYKRLIRIKTAHPALFSGRFKAVDTGNPAVSSWTMSCPTEKAIVINNLAATETTVKIPAGYDMPEIFDGSPAVKNIAGELTLPPYCTVVLAK